VKIPDWNPNPEQLAPMPPMRQTVFRPVYVSGNLIPFGTQGFGNNFGFVKDEEAVALVKHAVSLAFDISLRNWRAIWN
jgi:hypothetical protein